MSIVRNLHNETKKNTCFIVLMCYHAEVKINWEDDNMKKILAMLMAAALLLALCACGNQAVSAQKRTSLIMGIDPEYPPFSYLGDDGGYTGFDVEVCKAVCDSLGWELKIFPVNWDEKLVQLDSMECDCLAGKVVAVQLGTSGEALLNDSLADLAATFDSILTCDSFLKCFTELEGGAVDAVFVDLPVAESYVAEHDGLTVINESLGAEQYGIAFRSGDGELCAQIDAAVQALVDSGAYAEIASNPKYSAIVNNLIFLNK